MAKDGTILLVNKAGARNLGIKPEKVIGRSIQDFLPGQFETIQKRNQKIFKTGKGTEFEDLLELPDGKRWFWSNLQVVKDSSGKDVGIQIISHDITARKQNEELLNQRTEELEAERKALSEKNIALKEILEHIERERQDYKQNICRDVEQVTATILKRLKSKVGPVGAKDLEILENELKVMLAKDIDIFKDRYDRLTSRESEICDLIREGKSSKQMSEELNLSILTIQKHREQIRKKLGITNKGINLATYLRSH
jgi:PAS domain S-box-containing protein